MAWQSQLRDGLCDLPWWLSCARYGMVRRCGLLDCTRGTIRRRNTRLMERTSGAFSGILRHRGKRSVSPIALLAVQDKSLPLVTSVSGRVDDYALTGMQANWHIRF